MSILEMLFLGVGLSADAFAVSMCFGLTLKKCDARTAAFPALFFGGFQALMPVIGWLLGTSFEKYITGFDHWIAFGLLAFIGINMIVAAIKEDSEENCECGNSEYSVKRLFVLAIATSIDALAVGITIALLGAGIALPAGIIGIVTFVSRLPGFI